MTIKADPMIAAATVVLIRDSDEGMQTLLLRRNAKLNFAGGNWVFPGGRIDPADSENLPLETCAASAAFEDASGRPSGEFKAAEQAAVRETQEETGLTIGHSQLVYISHWVAPPLMSKRFSTWFFVLPVNDLDSEQVQIDDGEIHESRWLTPAKALANTIDKEMKLLPPTIVTLSELARYQNTDELLDYYRQRDPVVFIPHVFVGEKETPTEGQFVFIYHGDAGYNNTDPTIDGERHRLSLVEGEWLYENTVYK